MKSALNVEAQNFSLLNLIGKAFILSALTVGILGALSWGYLLYLLVRLGA